jgi:hypothetical protein
VGDSFGFVAEQAGALEDDLDAHLSPFDRARVFLGRHGDGLAVDGKVTVLGFDAAGVRPIRRVILEQVGVGRGVEQVVYGDHFQLVGMSFLDGAKDQTSNTAKAVNTYFYSHFKPPKDSPCDEEYKTIVSPLLP